MGNSSSVRSESKVVIIGGGYAGVNAAIKLDNYCHVILVDPKPFFHHCVGSLRAAVSPAEFAKKVMIPYKPALNHGEFKQDIVTDVSLSDHYVILESGERISYDYLVFACGSSNDFPGKLPFGSSRQASEELYQQLSDKIKESVKIVIIGGGPVGIEMAGEIVDQYQDKKIHIIHNKTTLCDPSLKSKFHEKILSTVKAKGINVILGERANLEEINFPSSIGWVSGPVKITTDNPDTNLDADLVLKCIGMSVNSRAYQHNLQDKMDEKNQLKVNEYFQVEGFENVFALGDCCNSKEIKEAYVAGLHADLVSNNIRCLLANKPLKKYKMSTPVMIVPVGSDSGVGVLPNGVVIGNFLSRKIKSRDLFVSNTWKLLKQNAP